MLPETTTCMHCKLPETLVRVRGLSCDLGGGTQRLKILGAGGEADGRTWGVGRVPQEGKVHGTERGERTFQALFPRRREGTVAGL